MNVHFRFLFYGIVFAFTVQISTAQTFDPLFVNRLQWKLDSLRNVHNFKGLSAALYHPNQGLLKLVSGTSSGMKAIHPEMEFGIGSHTKLFTAAAILKLSENKILQLDDPLFRWLSPMRYVDSSITIRQLLNHTSGIADYNDIPGYPDSILQDPNRIFQTSELVRWIGPPVFQAGSNWSYSNSNYLLAGMICERASGLRFSKLIRDSILSALGLDSSFFDVQETISGAIANPWQNNRDIGNIPRASLNSAAYSAGAMYSTSGEMIHWYQNLLSGKLLNKNSLNEMLRFVGSGNYGFGISRFELAGRLCYGHGGSIRGYTSFMAYDTMSQSIICVLINSNPAPARLVAEQILEEFLRFPSSSSDAEIDDSGFMLFPNPVQDRMYIIGSKLKINSIHLYGLEGKFLRSYQNTELDVSDLPSGMYILCISTDEKKYIRYILRE